MYQLFHRSKSAVFEKPLRDVSLPAKFSLDFHNKKINLRVDHYSNFFSATFFILWSDRLVELNFWLQNVRIDNMLEAAPPQYTDVLTKFWSHRRACNTLESWRFPFIVTCHIKCVLWNLTKGTAFCKVKLLNSNGSFIQKPCTLKLVS